jgi:hypothetical protein
LFGILDPIVDYAKKNDDSNQAMDAEANITLWNAFIDTVLVDCCF